MSARSETRRVSMYTHDRLSVDAVAYADGGLVIEGQDLRRNTPGPGRDEYEYFLSVEPADVPRLVAALGGSPDDDPLALLAAQGAGIVTHGETRWLREHHVPFELHTW